MNGDQCPGERSRLPRGHWERDIPASVVVFLVALPLCMGIALASGAPVSAGLVTGIVAGLVVGPLSGCPLQVSGPAAGLTVVVFQAIQQHGLEMLGLIVLLAGLVQLLAAVFGLGQWFRAISPAVVGGMLAGIGVLIFASQFHVMLDDLPKGSGVRNLLTMPQAVQKAVRMPRIPDRDLRHDLREVLQEIGELHRRQINFNEEVAERIPHHQRRPAADEEIVFDEFVPRQQDIRDELKRIIAHCQILFSTQPETLARVEEFGGAALKSQHVCLKDLRENQWTFLVAAQREAADDLATFQAAFKNHELAAGIGLLAIVSLVFWKSAALGRLNVIPAPLVAVVVGTVVAAAGQLPILYVEIPDSILEEMHAVHWATLANAPWAGVISTALVMSAVASAETLLSATAVDRMHPGTQTHYNRELFAQGVGNLVCGLLGALPMTGVIVRSSANVHAGAQTRWSATLHGIWLLVFVVLLGSFLRMIPTSALAAILVYTGYKLVDWKAAREFARYGYGELFVYLATMAVVVSVDLLTGVVTGLVLELARLAFRFSRLKVIQDGSDAADRLIVRLEGAATFLKLPKLVRALDRVPSGRRVVLDLSGLASIDHACLEALQNWARRHTAEGGAVDVDWPRLHRLAGDNHHPPGASESGTPFP